MQSLPIKYVIIDASFIKGVAFDAANTLITKGAISMANELDLEACAEHVESTNQIEFLDTQSCQYVQVFFNSKPLDEAAIGKILA